MLGRYQAEGLLTGCDKMTCNMPKACSLAAARFHITDADSVDTRPLRLHVLLSMRYLPARARYAISGPDIERG